MYSETPWLGLDRRLESPTTAMVFACRSRFSPATFLRLLLFAGVPDRNENAVARLAGGDLHQLLHFLGRKQPELARLQRSQFHRADLHTPQLFDQMPEVLEHDPDLLIAPLNEPHLIPGIIAAADQAQSGGRRA